MGRPEADLGSRMVGAIPNADRGPSHITESCGCPGEAYILYANVAARGEPATAEKNEERRSDEQWFHVLDPCLPLSRLYG